MKTHSVPLRTASTIAPVVRRPGVWFLAGLLAAGPGVLQMSAAGSNGDTARLEVEMPDYVVAADRELPPPESWRIAIVPAGELTRGQHVVVAPGYEILSNFSERNTRLFVTELQRRQLVGALLWPIIVQSQPRQPMTVVVDIGRQWGFEQVGSADGPRSVIDLPADIAWQSDPISTIEFTNEPMDTGPETVGSGTSRGRALNGMGTRVVLDGAPASVEPSALESNKIQPLPRGFIGLWMGEGFLAAEVRAGDAMAGSERPDEERLAAALNQEAALATLQLVSKSARPWLRLGLGWLIASTAVTPTQIEFAGVPAKLAERAVPRLADVLGKSGAMSIEEETLASAFVHYGLYGDDGKNAARFVQLVTRLEKEEPTDALFTEVLGEDLARTGKRLTSYLHSMANYRSIKLRGTLPDMPPVTAREATQSEVARLKARLALAQGRPDLALGMLRIAYLRREREPAMLAMLASLESSHGSWERAEKIVVAMRALSELPASVHLTEARIQFRKATDDLAPEARLDRGATAAIMQPLGRALRAGQGSEALWEFLAEVVLRSSGRPHESIAAYLEQATQRYPENESIRAAAESAAPIHRVP